MRDEEKGLLAHKHTDDLGDEHKAGVSGAKGRRSSVERLLSLDHGGALRSVVEKATQVRLFGGLVIPLTLANALFACGTVVGSVGQAISLDLWISALGDSGPYFVLFFASLAYVVIFFSAILVRAAFSKKTNIGTFERTYPQYQIFLVGFCDAMNGILVVFASPPTRTAPFLQTLLGNFTIPMTILFRFLVLRKTISLKQAICAFGVVLGLFLSLVPTIFDLNPGKSSQTGASGLGRILWPVAFMLGFAPGALMNVLEERSLKATGKRDDARKRLNSTDGAKSKHLDLLYFLAWSSLYQWLTLVVCFWTDLIPSFGMSTSMTEFMDSMQHGFECMAFSGGCESGSAFLRGFLFIAMYILSYFAGGLLLRFAEGATWSALVTAVQSPLGAMWWTLFNEQPFKWEPTFLSTTWYTIAGLAFMVPAITFYHMWTPVETEELKQLAATGDVAYDEELEEVLEDA